MIQRPENDWRRRRLHDLINAIVARKSSGRVAKARSRDTVPRRRPPGRAPTNTIWDVEKGCWVPDPGSDFSSDDDDGLPKGWVKYLLTRERGTTRDAFYVGVVDGKRCFATTRWDAHRAAEGETKEDKNIPAYVRRWRRQFRILT